MCPLSDHMHIYDAWGSLAMPATSSWCQGPVPSLKGSQDPARVSSGCCRPWLNLVEGPDNGSRLGESVTRTVRFNTVGASSSAEAGRCKGLVFFLCKLLPLLCGDIERNPGPLRVVQQNVNGLTAVKQASLLALDANLYVLQEVKKSQMASRIRKVPGYTVYRSPRDGHGGGTTTLVRQRSGVRSRALPWTPLLNDNSIEEVIVEITAGTSRFLVAKVYLRPPAEITSSFSTLLDVLGCLPSIISGDINLMQSLWWSDAAQSDQADRFADLRLGAGFELYNFLDAVTRLQGSSWSVIEATLARYVQLSGQKKTSPSVESNHELILFSLERANGASIPLSRPMFSQLFYSWRRADRTEYSALVRPNLPEYASASISACYRQFCDVLGHAPKASCLGGCRKSGVTLWTPEMKSIEMEARSARASYEASPNRDTLATLDRVKNVRQRIFSQAL